MQAIPGRNQVRQGGMRPRSRGAASFFLALVLLALPAAGAGARETLVVAGDARYPPFQVLDTDGHATGFDIELIRLLAEDLDMDLQVRLGDWEQALASLERGEIDVVPAFLSDQRDHRFLFTRPYLLRYHAVFGRKGQPETVGLAELGGHTVAVQERGLAWETLQHLEPAPSLVLVQTEPEALNAVADHRAEYALVPTGIGLHAINQGGLHQLVPLGPPLLEQRYALAVRHDRPDLVTALDAALVRVRESGTQDRLYREWLGQIGATPHQETRLSRAGWLLLPVALLAGWLAWRRARGKQQPVATEGGHGRNAPDSTGPADPPGQARLLADLRAALADGSLGYAVQPKQELRTGQLPGGEMLARWNHPEHGPLQPEDFIPLVESAGETAGLTLYMVRRAMEELARWPALPWHPTLSVNVGANDLADDALVDAIIEAVGDRGHGLILEVTETDLMHAPQRVADSLPKLRAHGVRISLDDFGTGHSTLTNLRQLAPEELKIDRSFIAGLLDSRSDRAIVRGVLQIAHEVGALVTAEGIEDAETLQWLREAGCDMAQGFAISPPVPPGKFTAMLAAQAG